MFICDAYLVIIVHWRCSHVNYINWFSYLLLHSDSSCCMIILLSLTCIFSFLYISLYWHDLFSLLYIILFVSTYCPFCYIPILFILFLSSLCVDMSDIPITCMIVWCMIILLCDACVVCLCGTHIYPLTSNSLVLVDLVSLYLIFDTRLVILFALRLS